MAGGARILLRQHALPLQLALRIRRAARHHLADAFAAFAGATRMAA
jgi:hypothetical protein